MKTVDRRRAKDTDRKCGGELRMQTGSGGGGEVRMQSGSSGGELRIQTGSSEGEPRIQKGSDGEGKLRIQTDRK